MVSGEMVSFSPILKKIPPSLFLAFIFCFKYLPFCFIALSPCSPSLSLRFFFLSVFVLLFVPCLPVWSLLFSLFYVLLSIPCLILCSLATLCSLSSSLFFVLKYVSSHCSMPSPFLVFSSSQFLLSVFCLPLSF